MAACFLMAASQRSIIYIDGFNLYYGSLRGGSNKWLDLQKYFTRLRQNDDIERIYYFTARISGVRAVDQDAYLRAVATLPLVETRLGKFKRKEVVCSVGACSFTGRRSFGIPEEKQTDVAIGVQILEDAFEDSCDRLIIVSGDSDLLPAVHAVKRLFPSKQIVVYVPARHRHRGAATELRGAADKDKTLPQELLRHSQFPSQVDGGSGGTISKPSSW